MESNDKIFYLSLAFSLLILSVIAYVSVTSPTKEEFVEVYWKVSKVENMIDTENIECKLVNCSMSGVYKFGRVNLNDKNYDIIKIDPGGPGDYYSLCIDFNENQEYCDIEEGPFPYRDTFFIDSHAFNILSLVDDIVIAHYPKEVKDQNFTAGFVIKSYYSKTMDFDVGLYVNETLQKDKILTIQKNQEVTSYFDVELPTEGMFKVKVVVSPLTIEKEAYIDFWVKREKE